MALECSRVGLMVGWQYRPTMGEQAPATSSPQDNPITTLVTDHPVSLVIGVARTAGR